MISSFFRCPTIQPALIWLCGIFGGVIFILLVACFIYYYKYGFKCLNKKSSTDVEAAIHYDGIEPTVNGIERF